MNVTLSDTERVLLQQAQRACRGQAGYVPVTVLLMLDHGRSAAGIAQDLGLDESTVYRQAQPYPRLGLAAMLAAERAGYAGRLTSVQVGELRAEIGRSLYTDCRQLVAWVFAAFGVRYSVSGLTGLLHRTGFSYKKTMVMPCQADTGAQAAFLTDILGPLLAATRAGTAAVYSADAAHPAYNTRSTHVWTETGKERPLLTVCGRERVNLKAALKAVVPTQVHLDETDCTNAQSTRRLYEKLPVAHPEGPVYVACNNARYYKNKELSTWLAHKRLGQVFLPPYSPNLKLIKRRWKFLFLPDQGPVQSGRTGFL